MKQSEFIKKSHIPEKLIRSTIKQIGGWEEFKDRAEDVTNHGADGGFSGFIYYSDTVEFTEKNKADILAFAKEQAAEFGENLFSMVGSFNCLKISPEEVAEAIYNHDSESRTTVYNALAWYILEEVCRSYVDLSEEA